MRAAGRRLDPVTETLDSYSLIAVYSAMSVYALAFILFTLDLARRSTEATRRQDAAVRAATGAAGGATTATLERPTTATKPAPKYVNAALALTVIAWALHLGGELRGCFALDRLALGLGSVCVLDGGLHLFSGGHLIQYAPLNRGAHQGFRKLAADGAIQKHHVEAGTAAAHANAANGSHRFRHLHAMHGENDAVASVGKGATHAGADLELLHEYGHGVSPARVVVGRGGCRRVSRPVRALSP